MYEVRLVEKDKSGRIKNVEIYNAQAFAVMVDEIISKNAKKLSLWNRIFHPEQLGFFAINDIMVAFEQRLQANLNKKKVRR